MEKIGRVLSKLTSPPDEDLPETKNQVFMLFEKRQERQMFKVQDRSSSSRSIHTPPRVPQPPSPEGAAPAPMQASAPPASLPPHPVGTNIAVTTYPAMTNPTTSSLPSRERTDSLKLEPSSATGNEKSVEVSRRNSSFMKRGSVSMDPIKKVDLENVYHVYKQLHETAVVRDKQTQPLGTGRFGYIKLAEHLESKQKIAIKFFPRPQIKQADFVREYNYSFFLSPHQNIVDTYEGMMQTSDEAAFFFVQEFCPKASLRELVESSPTGIGEPALRQIMTGVLSAVEYMHLEGLVHRNLKAENILIFDQKNLSRVKVTDFGLTRKVDASVKYLEYVNQYHAPELCETVANEMLTVATSIDIWALGILVYYCMKGKFPWQKASIMCKPYWEWEQWLKRKNPSLPKRMQSFTEKGIKVFKKTLCPKPKDRWTAKELRKWILKEKLMNKVKADSPSDHVYHPELESLRAPSGGEESGREEMGGSGTPGTARKNQKKKTAMHQWISNTLNTMAEISEQVVSARD